MKRLLIILGVILLTITALSFSGCSEEIPEPEPEKKVYHPLEKHP